MPALREIMTSTVSTVADDTPLSDAAQAMVRGRFGSVVVTRGSMILGILTERDVLRAAATGTDPTASPVAEWMTPNPVTAGPDLDTEEAEEIMLGQGFRHLPVVDGGDLVGIVSLRDLLSARIARSR